MLALTDLWQMQLYHFRIEHHVSKQTAQKDGFFPFSGQACPLECPYYIEFGFAWCVFKDMRGISSKVAQWVRML